MNKNWSNENTSYVKRDRERLSVMVKMNIHLEALKVSHFNFSQHYKKTCRKFLFKLKSKPLYNIE